MINILEIGDFSTFDFERIIQSINEYAVVVIIIKTYSVYTESNFIRYLNPNQVKAMNKYQKKNDRVNYALTKSVLNIIFSKIENISYSKIKWNYEEHKKPYITNRIGLNFNISHTQGCSIVALSKYKIGIDVENLYRDMDYVDIIEHFFSNNEKRKILNSDIFYMYWTSKEAYLKYKGTGLIQRLSSVEIINTDDNKVIVIDKEKDIEKEIFLFKEERYLFAICY
ncbi:MAG: 4'-phosphopantetheinyl transferase family protein [Filifactoraceae bacterium]